MVAGACCKKGFRSGTANFFKSSELATSREFMSANSGSLVSEEGAALLPVNFIPTVNFCNADFDCGLDCIRGMLRVTVRSERNVCGLPIVIASGVEYTFGSYIRFMVSLTVLIEGRKWILPSGADVSVVIAGVIPSAPSGIAKVTLRIGLSSAPPCAENNVNPSDNTPESDGQLTWEKVIPAGAFFTLAFERDTEGAPISRVKFIEPPFADVVV
jgi:hypothetical protein